MYHSIHKQKKANIATSTSDRVDLKTESDAREKEKYFIDSIHQEKLMILKEYFNMKMRKMYECVVCGCIEMVFLFEIFFFNTMLFFAPYHFLPYFWFICIHSLPFKLVGFAFFSFLSITSCPSERQ